MIFLAYLLKSCLVILSVPEVADREAEACVESVAAAYLKAGDRVVRGPDWEGDDQDGGHGGAGTILHGPDGSRCVKVKWDGTGEEHLYRMGKDSKFDLLLIREGKRLFKRLDS